MNWKIGILIAWIGITYCVFLGIMINDSNKCDELVTLTDGSKIECVDATSRDNGMTYIKRCDGVKVIVPTIRIKDIVKK